MDSGKATLGGAPVADILAAAIEIRKRIAAGTAAFLVKVKAHRAAPANAGADILAARRKGYFRSRSPKVGKVIIGALVTWAIYTQGQLLL